MAKMENTNKALNGAELESMLRQAVEALGGRSPVLERAPKMSKTELQNEIDRRIKMVEDGTLKGEPLDHVKAEARTLALLRLRRG
jgi:hypothetical protein